MKIVKLSAKQESESEDEVAATTPKDLEHDSGWTVYILVKQVPANIV